MFCNFFICSEIEVLVNPNTYLFLDPACKIVTCIVYHDSTFFLI
jgi:hypothetical protein